MCVIDDETTGGKKKAKTAALRINHGSRLGLEFKIPISDGKYCRALYGRTKRKRSSFQISPGVYLAESSVVRAGGLPARLFGGFVIIVGLTRRIRDVSLPPLCTHTRTHTHLCTGSIREIETTVFDPASVFLSTH